jgi:hypothetical protein
VARMQLNNPFPPRNKVSVKDTDRIRGCHAVLPAVETIVRDRSPRCKGRLSTPASLHLPTSTTGEGGGMRHLRPPAHTRVRRRRLFQQRPRNFAPLQVRPRYVPWSCRGAPRLGAALGAVLPRRQPGRGHPAAGLRSTVVASCW